MLPSIMVAWGTVMTLMGIVQNYHGLLLCRLFLGVAEAGLFPGVAYYLTMWYCTREIQLVSYSPIPTLVQVLIFISAARTLLQRSFHSWCFLRLACVRYHQHEWSRR
jgi:MFS family permease